MKKVLTLLVAVVAIMTCMVGCGQKSTSSVTPSAKPLPEESDNQKSFANRKLENEDLVAAVQLDDLWGYIDTDGEWVIEPVFEEALPFSEGYAAVCYNGDWGYIDAMGQSAFDGFVYDEATIFSNGYAGVVRDGILTYIDTKGDTVITVGVADDSKDSYYDMPDTADENGWIITTYWEGMNSNDFKYYRSLIDLNTGKTIIPPVYGEISIYDRDFIEVHPLVDDDIDFSVVNYYNQNGEEIQPFIISQLHEKISSQAVLTISLGHGYFVFGMDESLQSVGICDLDGNIYAENLNNLVPASLSVVDGNPYVLCISKKGFPSVYTDLQGNIILDNNYSISCEPFSCGLARVADNNIEVDANGEVVSVNDYGPDYYINAQGEKAITIEDKGCNRGNSFNNGYASIYTAEEGGYGYIDTKGELICECIFEDALDFTYVNYTMQEE